MPYGMRVLCAMVGGVLLMVGLLSVVVDVARRDVYEGIGPASAASGVGLGLVLTAFVRRD